MNVSVTLTLPKLDDFEAKEIMSALRQASPQIGEEIADRIRDRARPYIRRGALYDSIDYLPYTGGVSGSREVNLVRWYADDAPQINDWGRVYAEYQEGPPLGKTTYTNDPRHLFYGVETDDAPAIQDWADQVVEQSLNDLAAQAQAEAETIAFE